MMHLGSLPSPRTAPETTTYELFISYSRKDDVPRKPLDSKGWVTALRDEILADHRRFSTEPLRIFFDTDAIRSMDDWRHRILRGLRESRILLVCLSPNYFHSEYCRMEWDDYLQRQVHALIGHESMASIYFVDVPGSDAQGDAAAFARWLAAIEPWLDGVMRSNFTDLRPFFPDGLAALRNEEVRRRLDALGSSLWKHIKRARRASGVPGNLSRLNPHFIGRRTELRQLHENLELGAVGVVTAINGLGGQGKTELAIAYARGWADSYSAGLWVLGGEGKKEILPLLGELCADLALPLSAGADETADQRGRRVLAELERRTREARARDPDDRAACLILLDNVSEPALLADPQLAQLPREDWLRIVVTTRLGQHELPASRQESLAFVAVDALDLDDAARLIESHQPDARWPAATASADAVAAREVARELGGFTLAVESVAIYLGLHPDIRPADYLGRLRAEGLPTVDELPTDADVAAQMQHREKQIRVVLGQTLARLAPPERTALDYAALLPPDSVPWPWLHALVQRRHPDALATRPGYPDPWRTLRRRLEGLRLLTPGDHPEIARLHRIVAAHVRERLGERIEELRRELRDTVEEFAFILQGKWESDPAALWQLVPLQETVRHSLGRATGVAVDHIAGIVGAIECEIGRLDVAEPFLRIYEETTDRHYAANPESAQAAGHFSVSQEWFGDFYRVRRQPGDAERALRCFQRSLEIDRKLWAADPRSGQAARAVSMPLSKLGDLYLARRQPGDAEQALLCFQHALDARRMFLAADPRSAEAARYVSVSLNKLGDFYLQRGQRGDAERASSCFEECHDVLQKVWAADPQSHLAARDVSLSSAKLGDFYLQRGEPGDAEQALRCFEQSHGILRDLLAANPGSARAARDAAAVSGRLGDVYRKRGRPGDAEEALRCLRESHDVFQKLWAENPGSGLAARDVLMSFNPLGEVYRQRNEPGDAEQALRCFEQALAMAEELRAANPQSAQTARDVSVSLGHLGDFYLKRGQSGDAEQALRCFEQSLEIDRSVWLANPQSADAGKDMIISLQRTVEAYRTTGKIRKAIATAREFVSLAQKLEKDGFQLGGEFEADRKKMRRFAYAVRFVLLAFVVGGIVALVRWLF
jgi:tetratricopeptide (TPR) repeat protein